MIASLFALAAPSPATAADSGVEAQFVSRINGIRQSLGLQPLAVYGELQGVARGWADQMVANGGISHNPSLAGEVSAPWRKLGENVGVGPDVASLMKAFVNSPAHYRNIVDPDAALHWGMTANVVLMSGDASDAVLLPLSSIYRKGDAAAVWIYDEKARIVSLRPIAVAQYREDGAVVTGVTGGEWIVTAGVQKLREGETVRPYEAGANRASSTSPANTPASVPASSKGRTLT